MPIETRNLATGELIEIFQPMDSAAIEKRLARSVTAFREWRKTPFEQRARLMNGIADRLEAGASELGRLMTLEMGKLATAGREEALKAARGCRYYAEHAARFLADESFTTEAANSYVRDEPLGAVFAIMPWNFPFWQVIRFAAPAGPEGARAHESRGRHLRQPDGRQSYLATYDRDARYSSRYMHVM